MVGLTKGDPLPYSAGQMASTHIPVEAGGVFTYAVALNDVDGATQAWIQALPLGEYDHPVHGKIKLTPDRIARFADNVKNKVRGQDLDIDYDHKALTKEASGWVKDAEARPDGLWLAVEWTKEAAEKIKSKAYRYFSPEFTDTWKHPKGGQVFKDVMFGGALTNRPFLKDILPINLSELEEMNLDPTLEQLRVLFGLPADATAEQIQAKATELHAAATTATPVPTPVATQPNGDPVTDPAGSAPPHVPGTPAAGAATAIPVAASEPDAATVALTERLALVETALRLSETQLRLSELNTGKSVAFSPIVLDEAKTILTTAPKPVADQMLTWMGKVLDKGIVQLNEQGASNTERTPEGDADAIKQFNDEVNKLTSGDKPMEYVDAVMTVSANDPGLYKQYRNAIYLTEGAK